MRGIRGQKREMTRWSLREKLFSGVVDENAAFIYYIYIRNIEKAKKTREAADMNTVFRLRRRICLVLAVMLAAGGLSACSPRSRDELSAVVPAEDTRETKRVLVTVDDEPDTVDFQCTSLYYTVALNVFDRLVETKTGEDGSTLIVPSLAESWEVSDDGLEYTFHLRQNVTFSNGSPLTASDVYYTFVRLLTIPNGCNRSIAESILGAVALENREVKHLEGFRILSDTDFVITLEEPFAAFLSCLSMPGASILDEESTVKAGVRFGESAYHTVGTGPFLFYSWVPKQGIVLRANPACWAGAPDYDVLNLLFITDPVAERMMFKRGEIDILDLDNLGDEAEYFIHGDIYQNRLYRVPQIGISYVALNESVKPLNDVKVRRAMQLSLNRQMLLDAVFSGRGTLENGIFPHGLKGCNVDLAEIPCDPELARTLLKEAGYPNGFQLIVSIKSTSAPLERRMVEMAVSMWEKIGIRAEIEVLDEASFLDRRNNGKLTCYAATWSADYDDPDNFIYTFFGNVENTRYRSLCYPNEAVMNRVRKARAVMDEKTRLKEYQDLEKIIAQDDAAWIPLFSRMHYYVVSERVDNFCVSWNGWYTTDFRNMTLKPD